VNARAALLVSLVAFAVSAAQPTWTTGSDLRVEAIASLIDEERSFLGDPGPSLAAARRWSVDHRAPLYARDLTVGSSFIYPPIAAAPYLPLAFHAPASARSALSLVSRALFLVCVALLAWLGRAGRRLRGSELLAALLTAVAFFPLVHAVQLNQATLLVTALIGGTLVALVEERALLGGALFGVTLAFKPQLVLVLPLVLARSRSFVAGALAVGLALLLASLAFAGLDNHVTYAIRVLPALTRGYAYFANQSLNGFFQRLLVEADVGVFRMPPPSRAVLTLTVLTGLAAMVWALRVLRRASARTPLWLAFSFAWTMATMVSPIAWQHHYAPALFVFALLWRSAPGAPLLVAFVAMAGYLEVRGWHGRLPLLAASHVLYGALVLALVSGGRIERLVDSEAS
jgi:hypothetical protein